MNDTVKRDNRRSFPLFLLLILLSAVLGAAAGFFSAMAADRGTLDAIWAGLDRLMEVITPWAIPVCSAVLLITAPPKRDMPPGTRSRMMPTRGWRIS